MLGRNELLKEGRSIEEESSFLLLSRHRDAGGWHSETGNSLNKGYVNLFRSFSHDRCPCVVAVCGVRRSDDVNHARTYYFPSHRIKRVTD